MPDAQLKIILLLAGVLCIFIGLMPIISNRYFNEMNKKFWHSESQFLSEKNKYIYNRFIRQVAPILLGVMLIIYALTSLR